MNRDIVLIVNDQILSSNNIFFDFPPKTKPEKLILDIKKFPGYVKINKNLWYFQVLLFHLIIEYHNAHLSY